MTGWRRYCLSSQAQWLLIKCLLAVITWIGLASCTSHEAGAKVLDQDLTGTWEGVMGLSEGMSFDEALSLGGGPNMTITFRADGTATIAQPPLGPVDGVWVEDVTGISVSIRDSKGQPIPYLDGGRISDELLEFSGPRKDPSFKFYRTVLRRR